MNFKLLFLIPILSVSLFAWGKTTPKTPKNTATESNTTENNTKKTAPAAEGEKLEKTTDKELSIDEKKYLIISKLKTSEPEALDIYSNGKTVELNIPIGNITTITFDDFVKKIDYPLNSGIELITGAMETQKPEKFISVRSVSATLKNIDFQIQLHNGQWHRITFKTSLKDKRYSKINMLNSNTEKVPMKELKAKYFDKDLPVKEVSKQENLKAIRFIVDRLSVDTNRHDQQIEIEDKIDKVIIDQSNKNGLLFNLDSVVAEPFNIVGGIHESKSDSKIEKEIVLLNITIKNTKDKIFTLSEELIMTLFPHFIAFYYDKNNPTIAPFGTHKLLVVIEDHRLDKEK